MKKRNPKDSFSAFFLSLLALAMLWSCEAKGPQDVHSKELEEDAPTTESTESAAFDKKAHSISSVLYVQTSAEYKALCFQAYHTAKRSLKENLDQRAASQKPPAVVLDLDETVLDNSPYFGWLIKANEEYSYDTWKDWTARAEADTIPGSLNFTKYAKDLGVEVIYLSNRRKQEQEATKKNLNKYGYPNVADKYIFLKSNTSNKQPRRDTVADQYDILMLIGDNILDFHVLFEDKGLQERDSLARAFSGKFGKKFIVLPNPMYGSWKGELYGGYDNPYTAVQRDSIRRSYIESYK